MDDRTPAEKGEFRRMLDAIADLLPQHSFELPLWERPHFPTFAFRVSHDSYLTAQVLILLDASYASRFWVYSSAHAWTSGKHIASV